MTPRVLSFRTKLVLISGAGLLLGLAASGAASLLGMQRLAEESADVIGEGLDDSNRLYLTQYAEDSARQTNALLERPVAEIRVLAGAAQSLIDHEEGLERERESLRRVPLFSASLDPHRDVQAFQSPPGSGGGAVVATWGPHAGPTGRLPADTAAKIARTNPLDFVLAAVGSNGAEKLQVFFVGPEELSYLRVWPWVDSVAAMKKLYPAYTRDDFWSFFFPGLVDSWKGWAASPERLRSMRSQVTFTAPYADAGGGGTVVTLFHPLWKRDRHAFAGAVGIDLTLDQIASYVEHITPAWSGFAFLAQENGNVLAVNERGARTLRLETRSSSGHGVNVHERLLSNSADAAVANIRLPATDTTDLQSITIGGERYVLVLRRLAPFNVWSGAPGIRPERWTLGFLVPERELEATLIAAKETIRTRTRSIVTTQVVGLLAAFLLVIAVIALIVRPMTSALSALSGAAAKLMRKDYDARVSVRSSDEIGRLGAAFNAMADEVRHHTANLERMVEERTAELTRANDEISQLMKRLEAENARLGTEIEVARQLQMMVLPSARELRQVPDLDLAGCVQPATEVGGDYYDVFITSNGVTIGIGDVAGHGLESGVLMLMLQTAIRTLVAAEEGDPRRILAVANRVLFENIQRGNLDQSATLSLMQYRDGRVSLTGQHEEVIVVRRDGGVERVQTVDLGFPIGIEFDIGHFLATTEIPLGSGDVIVLYTDGITEAEDEERRPYGVERLCETIATHRGAPAVEIKDAVLDDLRAHIGRQTVYDDVTIVVGKRV